VVSPDFGGEQVEKMIVEWLVKQLLLGNKAATIGLAENSDDGLMA
jgi:hypothetical protein